MAWFGGKDRGGVAPEVAAAEHDERLRRCISLLMEGVRLHTCNEDDAYAPQFNRLMRQLGSQLDSAKEDSEILGVITAAIDGMKNARRESETIVAQTKEESKLLSRFLMTSLVENLKIHKPEAAEIISSLGPEFERAKTPEELRTLREKVEYVFAPEDSRAKSEEPPPPPVKEWNEAEVEAETADSPTGLRGRAPAKERLKASHSSRSPFYATVFFLEGYGAIAERFGADAAQDCLIAASNYLLQSLGSSDHLFHWDSNALLAIVSREGRFTDVTLEMLRICSARPQQSIRVGQRTVLAAMPIKPLVIAIHEIEDYEDLRQQIDDFARQGN